MLVERLGLGPSNDITAKAVVGVLTGVIISFALAVPLKRFGKRATMLLGALSLPLGAFLYGFILSTVLSGELAESLWAGYACAGFTVVAAVASDCAFVLFPLAILTTFLLARVIVPVKPG